jgi:hypothetical protein
MFLSAKARTPTRLALLQESRENIGDKLTPVFCGETTKETIKMCTQCPCGHLQLMGNLLITLAREESFDNLALPIRQ